MRALGKLWRGEFPLVTAYWVFGWLIGGSIRILSIILDRDLLHVSALEYGHVLLYSFFAVAMAYNVLLWGGLWRSAAKYPGRKVWRVLVQITVVLGVLAALGDVRRPFEKPTVTSTISDMVTTLNRDLPKQIDSETELRRVSSTKTGMAYHYRLVNVNVTTNTPRRIDSADLAKFLVKRGCSSSDIRELLRDVTITYSVSDQAETPITEITLKAGDCPDS